MKLADTRKRRNFWDKPYRNKNKLGLLSHQQAQLKNLHGKAKKIFLKALKGTL